MSNQIKSNLHYTRLIPFRKEGCKLLNLVSRKLHYYSVIVVFYSNFYAWQVKKLI